MPQFVNEEYVDLTLPTDTIFRATLTDMKVRDINWTDSKTGKEKNNTILEWWFEVTSADDPKYLGRKVKGETPAKLSMNPRDRFRNWAETLLSREIPPGMIIDTDDLLGLSADITVGHREDKKDSSKIWEYVDDVLPVSDSFDLAPPF